jgi:hypothetical protein
MTPHLSALSFRHANDISRKKDSSELESFLLHPYHWNHHWQKEYVNAEKVTMETPIVMRVLKRSVSASRRGL